MTKKNPQTLKEQNDEVIDSMETFQLGSSSNRISVTKELADSPAIFIKSLGTNFANHPCDLCDPDPVIENEGERFNFDLTAHQKRIMRD